MPRSCIRMASVAALVAIAVACSPLLAAPGETYLHFDGTGGVMMNSGAGLSLNGPFTVEAWVRPDRLTSSDGYQDLVISWNPRSIVLCLWNDHAEFAQTSDGSRSTELDVISQSTLNVGQWVHLAAVHTGSEIDLYINGVKDASAATTAYPYPGSAPTLGGYLGNSSSQAYEGGIDEIRVSNVARYTGDFTPQFSDFGPDSNTLMLYHCNEGGGLATVNQGSISGDASWTVGPTWATGNPVPEPSAVLLLALPVTGLFARRYARRRASDL